MPNPAAPTTTKALKTTLDPAVFEAPMGPNEGEIILVHYNGPGARIDSVHEEMAFGKVLPFLAGLPKEVSDPIAEDLSGMAFNILQDNYGAIKTRAVIRGALKFVAAKAVEEQAKKQGGVFGSLAAPGTWGSERTSRCGRCCRGGLRDRLQAGWRTPPGALMGPVRP